MGGDSFLPSNSSSSSSSSTGVESLDRDLEHEFLESFVSSGDEEGLSTKLENDSVFNGESEFGFGELPESGPQVSAISEARENQMVKVYADVLRSYEDYESRVDRLDEAKSTLLSYTPGSWVDMGGGLDLGVYVVPKSTSLVLIGPKGSGKSSLVNKISRVFENGVFASGRAQVSYNPSTEDGTCFVQRHLIPRRSGSFCLYDTRSLSDDLRENLKMLKPWMTKGVWHGELVKRKSDNKDFKARLRYKARRGSSTSQVTAIDFVIFVVNGLSVLESMNDDNDVKRQYMQMMAATFNNPLLSFKDDKPVVVVTHGDLLSLPDRVRVRVYLGELLGVPPAGQIFDIPESNDPATTLAIVDMLAYCLERADRNLPAKHHFIGKIDLQISASTFLAFHFMFMVLVIAILGSLAWHYFSSEMEEDWHHIRHLWEG